MLKYTHRNEEIGNMSFVLDLAVLFFIGASLGWCVELLFRRFVSLKKWINPGFLNGPYLPLYGFGLVLLYLLCKVDYSFITNSNIWQIVLVLITCTFAMTLIEYIAGKAALTHFHIKLWDYSKMWGNVQGIICPLFSVFWGIGAAGYYFLLSNKIYLFLEWFHNNLTFSFVAGMFYGVLIVDLIVSLNLSVKIKEFAKKNKVIIRYEELKVSIKNKNRSLKEHYNFIKPFQSRHSTLKENMEHYLIELKEKVLIKPIKRHTKKKSIEE